MGTSVNHMHDLRIWSVNISSWHRHACHCLELAQAEGVNVLLLQEVNLKESAMVGAQHMAKIRGWHVIITPAPASGRGGVAICVRQDLSLTQICRENGSTGQLIAAELEDAVVHLHLVSVYRKPDDDIVLPKLYGLLRGLGARSWMLGADMNHDVMELTTDELTLFRSLLCISGGHTRIAHPIDGIWVTGELGLTRRSSLREELKFSDHDVLEVALPRMCFARAREHKICSPCSAALAPSGQ